MDVLIAFMVEFLLPAFAVIVPLFFLAVSLHYSMWRPYHREEPLSAFFSGVWMQLVKLSIPVGVFFLLIFVLVWAFNALGPSPGLGGY